MENLSSGTAVNSLQRRPSPEEQGKNTTKGKIGRGHFGMTAIMQRPWKAVSIYFNVLYIDLNMVRAGVVEHPSQWPFCGYTEI